MEETVIGVFSDHQDADQAVRELQDMGINAKDISVVMKSPEEGKRVAGNDNVVVSNGMVREIEKGAVTGGIIGGLAGLLIGIAAVAIPGFGAILFVGPLAGVLGLTGAAATTVTGVFAGAATGGLVGVFEGIGVSKEDARLYTQRIQEGGVLLAVPAKSGDESQIMDVLEKYNAQQIRTISMGE